MLARALVSHLSQILHLQFATTTDDKGRSLTRDGMAFFWFHASGRRNTTGLTIAFDLVKRMDIFSYTSSFMSRPERDRAVYYLPIAADVLMPPVSLFVVKKRELTRLKAAHDDKAITDVQQLAGEVIDVNGLPSDLITMTEHADVVSALLSSHVRTLISDHAQEFISLHVTDRPTTWDAQSIQSPHLIRLEFQLPTRESEHKAVLDAMCTVALSVLDAVADGSISAPARKRGADLRKKAVVEAERKEQKKRAEDAAARRLEKKKEEEEAVGKMSADKQRKYEEKKRKKEIAARMRKATKK